MLGLGAVAFVGAYKLVSELVDRPARLAAGLAYAFGAVGYGGIREGGLGALVLGAATPFVLHAMLRLIGWMRPPGFVRGRGVAQIALGGAISAAFVPGALILFFATAVVLAAARSVLDRGEKAIRGVAATTVGLVLAWVLLLPWSTTWLVPGGPLNRLTSEATWRDFAQGFADHGIASVLLGQTPEGLPLFGLALPLFGLVAVLVGEGARRRLALALWTIIVGVGWITAAISAGVLRPIVASPAEVGVLASAAFAGLTGLAVGAFRLDLGRRGLSWLHAMTIGTLALGGVLVAAGIAPALWHGSWDPGVTTPGNEEVTAQITSLLEAEVNQVGALRALWVGDTWSLDAPSAIKPGGDRLVTGPDGQLMSDLFANDSGPGTRALDEVVDSIEAGDTDLGGTLLATFNIEFVVLEPRPGASRWLGQRDLALIRTEPNYYVLQNQVSMPRAGAYDDLPAPVEAIAQRDAQSISLDEPPDPIAARGESSNLYAAPEVTGPGAVWLSEDKSDGWEARIDDQSLEPIDGGWGNAWAIPSSASGELEVEYPRSGGHLVQKIVFVLAWAVAVGAAFSRGRSHPIRTELEPR
jgi:hypothetical protein